MIKLSDVMNGEQKKKKKEKTHTGVGSVLCRPLYLSRLHGGGKNNPVLLSLGKANLSFKCTSEVQLPLKSPI